MITSRTNEAVKHVRALSQKKHRDNFHEFIVEGVKSVREAITEKMEIQKVYVSESFLDFINYSNVEIVSEEVFNYMSDTQSPQGILAVVRQKKSAPVTGKTVFALDHVQDPGNVGTIIRTLDAAGISDLIVSEGCADIYNPKVVRSTMGGIFRTNIIETTNLDEMLNSMKEQRYKIVVTSLDAEKYIYDIDFDKKQLIIIGNESQGVSKSLMQLADQKVKIPMLGKAESLNASVAASVVAYEAVRQYIQYK